MSAALLEVCAFTIQSCLIAERAGAARVELCDNPLEGGTTPSWGTLKLAREKTGIPLYPIIRPRAGHYFYSNDEFTIMQKDIQACKELGCDGISVGISTITGELDTERMKRLVDLAYPMGVTCNRVCDSTPDLFQTLEELISCGCERVLTSGQKSAAPDAADSLQKLVQQADQRIIVMPGAGVNSSNVVALRNACGATEYHASARIVAPNPVAHSNAAVIDYGQVYIADEGEVARMVSLLSAEG